jgi:aspartate/methionine/tyrosine aminotransferase
VNPFDDAAVRFDLLRERAFTLRWATVDPDVIPLTAADPDFPVAPCIRDAIRRYTEGGVFSYGPPEGLPGFRSACAAVQRDRRRIADCTPDHILATDGAASAMFVAARFALSPGDEALIFDPVDFLFSASVEAAGGVAVRSPVAAGTGVFDLDALAAAIGPCCSWTSGASAGGPLSKSPRCCWRRRGSRLCQGWHVGSDPARRATSG